MFILRFASIPIKEQLLSVKKVMIYGAISFNSYKGTIVIVTNIELYLSKYSFNSYKGTIVIGRTYIFLKPLQKLQFL